MQNPVLIRTPPSHTSLYLINILVVQGVLRGPMHPEWWTVSGQLQFCCEGTYLAAALLFDCNCVASIIALLQVKKTHRMRPLDSIDCACRIAAIPTQIPAQ